jgi:hypothetical protein
MKLLRYKTVFANLLISVGARYALSWVVPPLAFVFGKLTNRIIYSGNFAEMVLLQLVVNLPEAAVSAVVGACVVWLVESDRPVIWTLFPALLYALFGFLGYHWARPPLPLDRVEQTIGALFPAFTCVVGGLIAAAKLTTPVNILKTSN